MYMDPKETDYSQKQRDNMDDSDFGDPENQAFPIKHPEDVGNAASRLHNSKGDQSAIKARIIRIAKRKGFALPQTWQDEKGDTKESVSLPSQSKDRIARIKSYFIEDNAESLNGRKYPKETVDKIIASIHSRLAENDPLPMTSYLSHEDADGSVIRSLVGKVTGAGREGTKGYVWLDVPDTQAGREIITLAKGGYIRSQSLRASGAHMYTSKESSVPLVGGNPQFEGIDWTPTPGLHKIARIADITE